MARRAYRSRVAVRRSRRQGEGKFRLHKPRWQDPFPWIPGTEPEKRVFDALVRMGIYFIFQGQVVEFEKGGSDFTASPVGYKPDFILPEYRVIIDPFSPYHHSQPEAARRDRDKIATYSMVGYAYYHPWAIAPGVWEFNQAHNLTKTFRVGKQTISIYEGVNAARNKYRNLKRNLQGMANQGTFEMLYSIPEITMGARYKLTDKRDIEAKRLRGFRLGENLGAGARSVGAANHKRRKQISLAFRGGTRL